MRDLSHHCPCVHHLAGLHFPCLVSPLCFRSPGALTQNFTAGTEWQGLLLGMEYCCMKPSY